MESAKAGPREGPLDFSQVKRTEAQRIWARRRTQPPTPGAEPPDVIGVGLSGGGIRSASFCLGALQALSVFKVIPKVDYLSTVSGGGYIGASMVAHMSENSGVFPFDDDKFQDSAAVRHIRNHSRYLFPKGTSDVLRSLGILTRGLVVNVVLILSLIVPLAALTILANPTVDHLQRSFAADLWRLFNLPSTGWAADATKSRFFFTQVMLAGLAIMAVAWALYRSALEEGVVRDKLGKPEFLSRWASRWAWWTPVVIFTFAAEFQTLLIEWIIRCWLSLDGLDFSSVVTALAGAAGASSLLTFFRGNLINAVAKAIDTPTLAGATKAVLARLILYAGALILPLTVYFLYLLVAASGIDFSAPGRGAFPLLPDLLSGPPGRLLAALMATLAVVTIGTWLWRRAGERGSTTWERLSLKVKTGPGMIGFMALIGAVAVLAASVAYAVRLDLQDRHWDILWNYSLLGGIFVAIGAFFSENANTLHGLYRDRLNAAFRLGRQTDPQTTLTLAKINTDLAPYLLINATLNARRSRHETDPMQDADIRQVGNPDARILADNELPDPAQRGRNAEFFLFTPDYVGSDATRYAPTTLPASSTGRAADADLGIDLATAVAISGAAVSSNSGRVLSGILSPTLALLNARLGYWLDNPLYVYNRRGTIPQTWLEVFRLYLPQEAFGLLRTDSKKVLLSDGGHIDNIGLYQLLKRRCKLIIIVDAEADPALNFGALADAQRFARIDFGHRVRIEWQPIREQSARRMRAFRGQPSEEDKAVPELVTRWDHSRHFALGEILYDAGEADRDRGVLLYIKANMTGDEPDYVTDYERRYPTFPHETTADQLFSEEQMEAYRALGFHSVTRALSPDHGAPTGKHCAPMLEVRRLLELPIPPVMRDGAGI